MDRFLLEYYVAMLWGLGLRTARPLPKKCEAVGQLLEQVVALPPPKKRAMFV